MTAQRGDFDRPPVTDRTDATDAEFLARLERLDRLEVADVAADVALQRVLALADRWIADAARADYAEPATDRDLSQMIAVSRWGRTHAAELRAAVAGPPPDGGDVR